MTASNYTNVVSNEQQISLSYLSTMELIQIIHTGEIIAK